MPAIVSSTLLPFVAAGMFASIDPVASTGSLAAGPVVTAPAVALAGGPKRVVPSLARRRCVDAAAVARAHAYASTRPGSVSFAVLERGRVSSFGGGRPYRSASIVKAMLLVADLRRHAARHTALGTAARSRLASMIRVSSNTAATQTFEIVGRDALLSVARLARMRSYSVGGWWGTSQVTASDQARFFGHLDQLLPRQNRAFARRLLRTITPGQTWGGARVARRHGYATVFKSGWLPRTDGWVVHQGMRVERDGCTLGIAVLTGQQPTMERGVESIQGVVERLL